MDFELTLEPEDRRIHEPSVEIDDPYVDLVYGPLVGAIAVLVLRYLHASIPLRASSICSTGELAEATGSKPRRMQGPLGRLQRHHLILLRRPVDEDPDPDLGLGLTTGRIILLRSLPLASSPAIERLPPLARSVARNRLER